MSRTIYESPFNLEQEDKVAELICKAQGVTMRKLSPKYPFDRAVIYNKRITGFMEIKCRTNESTKYPDYLISAAKLFHAFNWKQHSGLECWLVVQWTDRLGLHEINPEKNYECRLAGRIDRNDEQDIEPCFFIPIKWFHWI